MRVSKILVLAILFTLAPSPGASEQQCDPNSFWIDMGCAGCNTSFVVICEPGEECEPCAYQFTTSLVCYPTPTAWTSGLEDLECGDRFSYRAGGCATGPNPWGWGHCECEDCP